MRRHERMFNIGRCLLSSIMNLKKYGFVVVLVILILATAVRLWGINSESYWLDETISIKQAQENYGTTIALIKNDVNLPLYVSVLHFWVKLFGISESSSRSLSLLFGVLSVGMAYLLGRKLFSERVAILASLFMSLSPLMIYYSQETRGYSLFVFLTLVSFYFFVSYLEKKNNANLVAYVIFSLFLIYTHLFAFLVIVVQNVYILYINSFRIKALLSWFVGQAVLLVCFLPWFSILLNQIANSTRSTMWIATPTSKIVAFTFLDFFGDTLAIVLFIIVMIFFFVTGNYQTVDCKKLILPLSWLILPFVLIVTYSVIFSSLYATRYLLFTLPALYLLFAVFVDKLNPKHAILSRIIICALIISSSIAIVDQVNRTDKDDWRSVSAYIKQNVQKDEVIFIDPFYHQEPFAYYYDRDCFNQVYIPSCDYNKHRIVSLDWKAQCCNATTKLTALDGINQLGYYRDKKIWIVSVRPELYDENNSLFDYFKSYKKITAYKEFGDIKLYRME
jgi:mannosyltransferase